MCLIFVHLKNQIPLLENLLARRIELSSIRLHTYTLIVQFEHGTKFGLIFKFSYGDERLSDRK